MLLIKNIIFFALIIFICLDISSCAVGKKYKRSTADSAAFDIPPAVRFFRIYGDNDERNPPILLISDEKSKYNTNAGHNSLTLEFDVDSELPPNVNIKFIHCDVNWKETENAIVQNNIFNRTSNVEWTSSTFLDDFYSFRGKTKIPSPTVKFEYSGNYKAQIFVDDYDTPIAEQRFFVVKPMANTQLRVFTGLYDSQFQVTRSSLTLETIVWSEESFFDNRMHSLVYYRNNRYYEPLVCSNDMNVKNYSYLYNFELTSIISGFSTYEKRFRLEGIPAENVYRTLYMSNPALFPRSKDPIRLPLSDIARNGNYYERDNDGVMRTDFVSNSIDDYVLVEFILDPETFVPDRDVFISGSFNNWKPDRSWIMNYDEKLRLYRSINWVRRGNHDYLYGVGSFNPETNSFEKFSFDYYEGNTIYSNHSYYGFVYYNQVELGGFDSIIGVIRGGTF